MATVNVGSSGSTTASAGTGETTLPVNISLCQTNPTTGACLSPPASTVTTTINANATPTFGIFVQGTGNVAFNPATNRIFVRFKDTGGVTRGATSVAVRTPWNWILTRELLNRASLRKFIAPSTPSCKIRNPNIESGPADRNKLKTNKSQNRMKWDEVSGFGYLVFSLPVPCKSCELRTKKQIIKA